MTSNLLATRAVLSHRVFTGVSDKQLQDLILEVAPSWQAALEGRRERRRGGARKRAQKRTKFKLPFIDQLLSTLAVIRNHISQEALAVMYGVDQATISRGMKVLLPILARRGVRIPSDYLDVPADVGVKDEVQPDRRLHTLHDVFAFAAACGVTLRLDATEVQVRRPRAHRKGRKRYISGKARRNTIKALVISDAYGRPLFTGEITPGRMHDATQAKLAAIDQLLLLYPQVQVLVDAGYRRLIKEYEQVEGPPPKPKAGASEEEVKLYDKLRHEQSSERIVVEHAISRLKKWRTLVRFQGPREQLPLIILAVAGLVSDRY